MIEAFILRMSLKYMKAMQVSRFWNLKMIFQTTQFFISHAKKTKRNKPYRNKTWAKVWEVNHNRDYWSEKQIEEKKIDILAVTTVANCCVRVMNCFLAVIIVANCFPTLTVITVATFVITIIIANIIIGNLFSVELRISFQKAM